MSLSSRRPLENFGDTCRCPKCRAWVYRNTLRSNRCIKCNLLAKREPKRTTDELLAEMIEAVANKMNEVK